MTTFDTNRLIARRANAIDASGIRRVFELGAKLKDPINLSIGQPDFPVPEPITAAAVNAIEAGKNGYTVTQGVAPLIERINEHLHADLGWKLPSTNAMSLVTSGTSGALLLTMMAILDEGDELVIPDPYFVMYPHLATMCGAKAVMCDCGPDLRMTAERVEPLLTDRTKAVLINSPSNPAGVVLTKAECDDLYDLCTSRNVLLISDEIYDEFTYADARTDRFADGSRDSCPSPCRGPGRED
ncbi:MAG: aminotransferase class I/II-fold pyridoxal phosphate-dependent enzyme, partial [Planctomycetota bacterium]